MTEEEPYKGKEGFSIVRNVTPIWQCPYTTILFSDDALAQMSGYRFRRFYIDQDINGVQKALREGRLVDPKSCHGLSGKEHEAISETYWKTLRKDHGWKDLNFIGPAPKIDGWENLITCWDDRDRGGYFDYRDAAVYSGLEPKGMYGESRRDLAKLINDPYNPTLLTKRNIRKATEQRSREAVRWSDLINKLARSGKASLLGGGGGKFDFPPENIPLIMDTLSNAVKMIRDDPPLTMRYSFTPRVYGSLEDLDLTDLIVQEASGNSLILRAPSLLNKDKQITIVADSNNAVFGGHRVSEEGLWNFGYDQKTGEVGDFDAYYVLTLNQDEMDKIKTLNLEETAFRVNGRKNETSLSM